MELGFLTPLSRRMSNSSLILLSCRPYFLAAHKAGGAERDLCLKGSPPTKPPSSAAPVSSRSSSFMERFRCLPSCSPTMTFDIESMTHDQIRPYLRIHFKYLLMWNKYDSLLVLKAITNATTEFLRMYNVLHSCICLQFWSAVLCIQDTTEMTCVVYLSHRSLRLTHLSVYQTQGDAAFSVVICCCFSSGPIPHSLPMSRSLIHCQRYWTFVPWFNCKLKVKVD